MKSLNSSIEQMMQLLDELVSIATQLRQVSLQVVSEEELAPLQQKQEEILKQLEEADHHLQKHYARQVDAATQEHFHSQLEKFQKLNQEFLQNLAASHGLIQFDLKHLDDEDRLDLSQMNKPFSVDHPPIDNQEDQKS